MINLLEDVCWMVFNKLNKNVVSVFVELVLVTATPQETVIPWHPKARQTTIWAVYAREKRNGDFE